MKKDVRVVVTGMGIICPLGVGLDWVWNRLISGESGISSLPSIFENFKFPCKAIGQIPAGTGAGLFDIERWCNSKDQRRMDRFISLGIAAALMALDDAGWSPKTPQEKEYTGVSVGAGIGGLPKIEENSVALHNEGFRRVSPFFVPSSLINLAAGHIAIRTGACGPNFGPATACSAGSQGIGQAYETLKSGKANVMIAGGTESTVCPIGIAGFASMQALSNFQGDPTQASRPWDKQRDGFVMAEGAGVLVLETLDHALKRGAKIYAEVCGFGTSCDAYHITTPSGLGAQQSMAASLKDAGLSIADIGYINAHGTSTPLGDTAELKAVEALIEADPSGKARSLKMSSTKSSIGHALGASGAIEAIFSILALVNKRIPPTLNLQDPEETFIDLVPHTAQSVSELQYALSNSFGFGGNNSTLIFGQYKEQ
ncbi:MAG: beta-ketoacyl-[acyl-carrier-protein] synthase II [Alphaproteobacteria bacterium 40-19]|nr:MAG: beta-ketoacyl-[acyl-carrier-protein] synthase II [Alphaproteobacteria bacterium 40-19]